MIRSYTNLTYIPTIVVFHSCKSTYIFVAHMSDFSLAHTIFQY